jgi:type I restriction enzyme M protein
MFTGELRNKLDKLWTEFWTGGIANPLTVIEQISFLMFARFLDIAETREEKKAQRTGKPFRRLFSDTEISDKSIRTQLEGLVKTEQDLRWSKIINREPQEMLRIVRDGVFPHFKTVAVDGAKFGEYMKDAFLMIQKPSLLVTAANMVDELPLTQGDTKGDLYEYLLSKLTTAGVNGQFRTPRHIIRLMVELLAPRPDEVVGDPACGTAGFLVETMHYLLRTHTSPAGIFD